jgi:pyruvate formate lyase activating enzyme
MKIGGYLPQSMIDYPGKIAAVLFTQGCNFRCGYCHNPELVLPGYFEPVLDENSIFNSVRERIGWLDALVVTGGEPTVHHDLPDFLQRLKAFGLLIKLDTNGSQPEMLKSILNRQLVDYVAMDIKNIPTPESYSKVIGLDNCNPLLKNILRSVGLLKQADIEVEFRTTMLPGLHTPKMIDALEKLTEDYRYTVHPFRQGQNVESMTNAPK